MAGSPISALLGEGSVGRQLLVWGILNNLISTAGQPVLQQVLNDVYPKVQSGRITADEAAEMVLKGIMSHEAGASEATATGYSADRFAMKVRNQGEPISPQDALQALRREVIPEDKGAGNGPSFMEAVRQSRLRDEWAPVLQALQWLPLSPADAVDAVVESQVAHDYGEAQARLSGVDPEHFRILVNTRGNPPSPTELLELHRRGYIPLDGTGPDAISVQQGVYEGATKNKWYEPLTHLLDYVPPPRTVTALLREGSITDAQAAHYFAMAGLTDDLVHAYIASAHHTRMEKARELTEATILDMFEAKIVDRAQAADALRHLGYTEHDAGYLLTLRDMRVQLRQVTAATSRVQTLYVGRKLTAADTKDALHALGYADAVVTELLTLWDLERRSTARVLTEAQVVAAFHYQVIDGPTAMAYLEELGYSAYDAWVLLSDREHKALPNPPEQGRNVSGRAQ